MAVRVKKDFLSWGAVIASYSISELFLTISYLNDKDHALFSRIQYLNTLEKRVFCQITYSFDQPFLTYSTYCSTFLDFNDHNTLLKKKWRKLFKSMYCTC